MIDLFILMMERVGLIILLAFLLVNVSYFKKILLTRKATGPAIQLIIIFGLFAIISNFTGIEIVDNHIEPSSILFNLHDNVSIANTRTLVIGVSGLVVGPTVGGAVGLIAGFHRFLQGSSLSFFYVPSSLLVGILSGYLGNRFAKDKQFPTPIQAALIGALMETIQMTFVMLFSGGTITEGFDLVKFIALPMILLNSIGTFIFFSILTTTLQQEEQAKAVQTHDVLELAAKTLPYFREGLNEVSSQQVAKIIKHYTKVSAISITDTHQILAHVGVGDDHHIPELEVITELSRDVLKSGDISIVHNKEAIGCTHPNCPLEAAIVIPLIVHERIIGTLKMYFTDASQLTHVEEQLAEGLGSIFSSQIELGEIEIQSKLLKEAEIKSLQSQVNPHFFFNAMNTISAMIRKDANQARTLLLQLSTYFRGNLQGARQTLIPLKQELAQVDAYLSLEQARFPNRYNIQFDITEKALDYLVPPYAIQILIENTIKHAFGSRKDNNHVTVTVSLVDNLLQIQVTDNGFGITEERLVLLGKVVVPSEKGTGTALENLAKRLKNLFGEKGTFSASNNTDTGASFIFTMPLTTQHTNHS